MRMPLLNQPTSQKGENKLIQGTLSRATRAQHRMLWNVSNQENPKTSIEEEVMKGEHYLQALIAQMVVPISGSLGCVPFVMHLLGVEFAVTHITCALVHLLSFFNLSERFPNDSSRFSSLRPHNDSFQFVYDVSTASPIINLIFIAPYRK